MASLGRYRASLALVGAVIGISITSAGILAQEPPEAQQKSRNQVLAECLATEVAQTDISGYDIEVEYDDGNVTLRGRVADQSDADRIVEIVRSKEVTRQVVSKLTVVPQKVEPAVFQETKAPAPPPAPVPPSVPAAPATIPMQATPAAPEATSQNLTPAAPQHVFGHRGGTQYDYPYMPPFAWPAYAPYANYSAVQYPRCYPPQAWPNIGPFNPYPEPPMDWRSVELKWNDGYWYLRFRKYHLLRFLD